MKIYVMEECPSCKALKAQIKELGVEDKFTYVDIQDNYDGFLPETVPVLQHAATGTIPGENLPDWINTIYGK